VSAARRLYLHIGLQKTGTSYLQAALLQSRDRLAEAGLDLVPPTKRASFELMSIIRERYPDRRDSATEQATLAAFTEGLRRAPGTRAVFSQESLAACSPRQIDRLLAVCGDREVHVVLTVRDLARQLPSSWQEHLKAGGTARFAKYLARLQEQEGAGRAQLPWIHLDAPAVLDRWSQALGSERIHVVTVPPPGSPTTLLLERFASVLDVEVGRFVPEEHRSNSSLGVIQAEVLRRVNRELPEDVHRRLVYGEVIKRGFSTGVLAQQERRSIRTPESVRGWCEDVAERQIVELDRRGYAVVGSLDELRCRPESFGAAENVDAEAVATSAVQALSVLLTERARAGTSASAAAPTAAPGRLRVAIVTARGRCLRMLRRLASLRSPGD